jgi:hypothetical protein
VLKKKKLPKLCATTNVETPPEQQKILKCRAQESNQHEESHAHRQKMGSSDFKSHSIQSMCKNFSVNMFQNSEDTWVKTGWKVHLC